jgi:SsrA-binding protein
MEIAARNKKALHDYEILEKVVAGIALSGSEVKSIRAGKVNLADSFATCSNGEMFVHHMHIAPYGFGGVYSPDSYRKRKLLLHKKQILWFGGEMEKKHLTMIPLMVYFDKQWIKVELGLGKGMKKYDKREKIAAQESKRHLAQIMKIQNKK